jgi:hypothetical protein
LGACLACIAGRADIARLAGCAGLTRRACVAG